MTDRLSQGHADTARMTKIYSSGADSMIHVLATIEIAAGKRAEYLEQFHRVEPLVQAEVGCIEYGAGVDVATSIPVQIAARPNTLMVIEKWSSVEALQAHLKSAHMAEYRTRVKDLVTGVILQVLDVA